MKAIAAIALLATAGLVLTACQRDERAADTTAADTGAAADAYATTPVPAEPMAPPATMGATVTNSDGSTTTTNPDGSATTTPATGAGTTTTP